MAVVQNIHLIYDIFSFNKGWTTTVVGQPFDIIKVRLQAQQHDAPIYKGAFDCLKKLLANEGPLALYKGKPDKKIKIIPLILKKIGTLAPLIGCGLCLSVQFGVDGTMKKVFKVRKKPINFL